MTQPVADLPKDAVSRVASEGPKPAPQSRIPLVLALAAVAALLPFLWKPFHIDDPLFLWSARQIQSHPFDFYGVTVNWYGDNSPLHEIMQNPPGMSYFLAAVAALVGWSEPALHAACLLPAVAAVLGTWKLARRFCPSPEIAAAVVLVSPLFLVSSTNVMCDTLLLAWYIAAVELWLDGLDRRSTRSLALAGLCIAAAALTKYFGISLLPLLLVYTVLVRRRVTWELAYLLIPAVLLAGFQWWTKSLYGHGLLFDAADYALSTREQSGVAVEVRLLTALSFLGGGMLPLISFLPLLLGRRLLAVGVIGTVASILLLANCQIPGVDVLAADSPYRIRGAIHLGLFVSTGIFALGLAAWEVWSRRDAAACLLTLWILGTFVFAALLNWSVNGRSLLPLAPPLAIVLARRLGSVTLWGGAVSCRLAIVPLALSLVVGWMICSADYESATSARWGAREINQKLERSEANVWFAGHWGFQYYMEQSGARPLTRGATQAAAGDIVVVPFVNTNVFGPEDRDVVPRQLLCRPLYARFSTMQRDLGAGFYADVFGPLPFVWGQTARECFSVLEFRRGVSLDAEGRWR